MKKLLFLLMALGFQVFGGNFVSTQSGLFSSGSTWVGGVAPSANLDTWTISAGHEVIYDLNNSGFANGWGASTNSGTLTMSNGIPCWLRMGGNLSGLGIWVMGTSNNPIGFTSSNTPGVVCEFTGSVVCTMDGTNNLRWFGDTNHCFTLISSNFPTIGDTQITFSNTVPNIVSNDVLFLPYTDFAKAGQANQFYVVAAVTNNVVYLQTNLAAIATISNTWYGNYSVLTNTSINTLSRTTNTMVSFCSLPIVFMEKAQRSTSTFGFSKTNILTGIRIQNLGRGLFTGVNGYTINNCSVNSTGNGGFGYSSCIGFTINNCIINASVGGLGASSSSLWVVNNCIANSSISGGFGSFSGSFWKVNNCIANSCLGGGLGYSSASWTVSNCVVNFCSNGGFGSSCSSWIVNNSTANSCTNGAFGASGCNTWVVNNSAANSCINGGLGANTCNSWLINGFTNNSDYSFVNCSDAKAYNYVGITKAAKVASTSAAQYSLFQFDNNYYLSDYGYATNVGNGYAFYPSTNSGPNPVILNLSVRPNSTRVVTFSALSTNNIIYNAGLNLGSSYPTTLTTFCTGNSGNTTNISLSISNNSSMPNSATLMLTAQSTNYGFGSVSLNADNSVLFR